MNNNEKSYLLSQKGLLLQTGRSKSMSYDYDRNAVPALRRLTRLKERNRFIVTSPEIIAELSLFEMGFLGILTASVYDLNNCAGHTNVLTDPFSFGSMELPAQPYSGDVIFRASEGSFDFGVTSGKRYLRTRMERFDDVRMLYVNLTAEIPQDSEGFCTSEGFSGEPECFRLCHKETCMPVSGSIVYGADKYVLSPENSFVCMDWERSILPQDSECIWYLAQGLAGDVPIALSFAAHTDTRHPDVCAVFYDGVVYDCGVMSIYPAHGDSDDALRLRSENGKVDVIYTPAVDSVAEAKLFKLSIAEETRTFGTWSGTVRLGSMTVTLSDIPGFSEKKSYRW